MMALAVLHVLSSASAGPTTLALPSETGPTQAVELDQASRGLADVQSAIKSFEKRDFELCVQQLAQAWAAHPDLLPPHALFAKLAFLGNQGALIRPALERAVVEDGGHPEVFILFGNLALAEGRLTDAAVHFEKATALAAAPRWSAEQRDRFARLCHQGNALVAENRRDWKAARGRSRRGSRKNRRTRKHVNAWARPSLAWANLTRPTKRFKRRPRPTPSSSRRPFPWAGSSPVRATYKKPENGWTTRPRPPPKVC